MTQTVPTPATSLAPHDHAGIGDAVATRISELPHRPRLLGLGEPMHGEEEFSLLRNAVFAALVERAGFTAIALETSAWHGRVVDAYVRGEDADEDAVMADGFTHGFGGSPANRALVHWMREQNRHRPVPLRFAAFDAPVEMDGAPSPRAALRELHGVVGGVAWDAVDELLGADEPWEEPAAAMEPARSVGAEPRVAALRAITDDLRWLLAVAAPRLHREIGPDRLDDARLAGRTAAGLLAYHAAMAWDGDDRWNHLAALRDMMMADNLQASVLRGRTLAFAHNQHLRTGATSVALGPMTLQWQPAGAHLAETLGEDYHVVACGLGDDVAQDVGEPEAGTIEGTLHRALGPGVHLLPAAPLYSLARTLTPRTSPTFRYIPFDDTVLGQVDDVLFLHGIAVER